MKFALRLEPYDPDAIDADGDGIVQEGTAWERPGGTRLVTNLGQEIQRGLTASARPQIRVVDSNGSVVQYRPTYDVPSLQTPQRSVARPGSKLRSLSDMGVPTVGQILSSRGQTLTPQQTRPNPADDLENLVRAVPANRSFRKFGNRDRAFRKADTKAQELSFTSGRHYLIETDDQFVILPESEYASLIQKHGEDEIKKLAKITSYERPKAQDVNLEDALAGLKGPEALDGEIDSEKYFDGVMEIHYKGGSLADVDEGVFAAVVFDEGITDEFGNPIDNQWGSQATFEDIMLGAQDFNSGDSFENRRFKFQALKDTSDGDYRGGIWSVFKVTDKETGEVWFIKSSTYGANDGLLENVGMRAGAQLDLAAKPGEKNIRTGSSIVVLKEGRREVRWTAMRNVEEWDNPEGPRLQWVTAHNGGGLDTDTVHLGDLSQIIAMDFIFGNTDRHEGNFMIARDADGRQRLAIIDNGLLSGGRIYESTNDWGETLDPQYFVDFADTDAGLTLEEYAAGKMGTHTGFGARLISQPSVLAIQDRLVNNDVDSDEFENGVRTAVKRLRDNLDAITSPEYFERRGIPLTETETAHLDAVRTIALARIKMLESNPYAISEYITNTPVP